MKWYNLIFSFYFDINKKNICTAKQKSIWIHILYTNKRRPICFNPSVLWLDFDQIPSFISQAQSVFNCQSKQHLEVDERALKEARKMDRDCEWNMMRFFNTLKCNQVLHHHHTFNHKGWFVFNICQCRYSANIFTSESRDDIKKRMISHCGCQWLLLNATFSTRRQLICSKKSETAAFYLWQKTLTETIRETEKLRSDLPPINDVNGH